MSTSSLVKYGVTLVVLAAGPPWPLAAGGNNQSKLNHNLPNEAEAPIQRDAQGRLLIHGRRIGPGAQLEGAALSHVDLHGLDLKRAKLKDADLRGADLRWADLSYADLRLAHLDGAKLDGARLYKARVFASKGARFADAHLHPFFSEDWPERAGAVRLFKVCASGQAPEAFLNPVAGPGGNVYWLNGARGGFTCLSTTGATFAQAEDTRFRDPHMACMAMAPGQLLVLIGQRAMHGLELSVMELGQSDRSPIRYEPHPRQWPGRPLGLVASPWGTLILLWPKEVGQLRLTGEQAHLTPYNIFPGFAPEQLVFDPVGPIAYFTHPADHVLLIHRLRPDGSPGRMTGLPLATQEVPDLLVVGSDHHLWTAKRGESRICAYDPDPAAREPARVLELPEGGRVHQLALGPDGNLWATVPEADRLLRITPAGVITPFDLPRGTRPGEILPYLNGRMLFLSLKGDRLGTIRAVASRGKVWPEGTDETPEPARPAGPTVAPEPQAEHPPLAPGALEGLLARTEPRLAQAWAVEAEEPPDAEEAAPGSPFTQAEAPEPPAPRAASVALPSTPRERLARANILLTRQATRHILTRHRHGLDNGNSLFLPRYSRPEALDALLAESALSADRTGLLGKVRMWDRRERSYTFCTQAHPVGTYRRDGQDLETRTFLIVTAEAYDAPTRRWVHGIVTAYPVPPE